MAIETTPLTDVALPRLKSFGPKFKVFFNFGGLKYVLFRGAACIWALTSLVVLLNIIFTFRHLLAILSRICFDFGVLLNKFVNQAVMGIIYFGLLVPIAFVMRTSGKRFLKLDREPEAASYWIERTPPGPEPISIKWQL